MANQYVLDILINAKDNASSVLDGVGKKAGGVGQLLGGLAVGGAALAGTALVAVGTAAFQMSNQVDEAANQMTAALGLSQDGATEFETVMKGVFKNNVGDGFGDIADSLVMVEQNLARLSDRSGSDLQQMTEDALALRDVYGEGVNETTSAAATLMENFGLDSQQAFDFLTKGYQKGLNASGDFLDTIEEYSTQFKSGGATADQFFSLLDSGMQGGMLGTDRAADAFKEFRVRIQDGSKTTSTALGQIGIDADALAQGMADGTITAADAFQTVITRLGEVDDENVRIQAGVGLLGTQFEDLGTGAALALSLTGTALGDMAGATDDLNIKYDNLGSAMEGFKRRGLLALEPLGDALLGIANDAMPHLEGVFSAIEEHGPAAMETLSSAFGSGMDWLEERLGGNNERVQAILEKAGEFWDQHGEGILHVLDNLGEMAGVIFDRFIGNILDIVDLGLSILTGDWEGAADALTRIWEGTKESASQIFQLALDSILTLIDGFVPGFKEKGQAVIDGLLDGLKEKWQGVLNWFGSLRLPSLPGLGGNAPGYAVGTAYAAGGWAMVGEAGPELVRLPRGASVRTANQTAGAMRGGDTYVTMYVTGNNAQETANATGERLSLLQRRKGY